MNLENEEEVDNKVLINLNEENTEIDEKPSLVDVNQYLSSSYLEGATLKNRKSESQFNQQSNKSRAQKFWDILRLQVHRGFFHSILNQNFTLHSDFLTMVDELWRDVHKYSPFDHSGVQKDSTTDFVMAGWAKIKAAQYLAGKKDGNKKRSLSAGAKSTMEGSEESSVLEEGRLKSEETQKPNEESLVDEEENSLAESGDDSGTNSYGKNRSENEYLSLDTVPNVNVSKILKKIAKGLHEPIVDELDFFTIQVYFNRGWKLLLLGLRQAESFGRYMSMYALSLAIPVINDTLLDSTTRNNLIIVLVNLMVSDERAENRLRAVYLLGQLGSYLGSVREHDALLKMAFTKLTKKLLELQYDEKNKAVKPEVNRDLKIYLYHAIGKYTRTSNKHSRQMDDLVLYIINEEFTKGDTHISNANGKASSSSIYVIQAILGILNNEMNSNEANQKYIGAIFKPFIHPYMRSKNLDIQMMAVQFISKWLPIMNEDANVLGIEALISGLFMSKKLDVINFNMKNYEAELREFLKRKKENETRIAVRSKLVRQLLQVPGTWANLNPIEGHPGFFIETNSSMINTTGILVKLPIHPKSSVTISRPIPPIPGVPNGVTTISPDEGNKPTPPRSMYETLERRGKLRGLPIGYSYGPNTLVELKVVKKAKENVDLPDLKDDNQTLKTTNSGPPRRKPITSALDNDSVTMVNSSYGEINSSGIRKSTTNEIDSTEESCDEEQLPVGMSAVMVSETHSRKFPVGMLSISPFSGYDPEKIDKVAIQNYVSAIYNAKVNLKGKELNKIGNEIGIVPKDNLSPDIPDGFIPDRHPVLFPSKLTLANATNPTDFPVNSPVVFDILQPGVSKLQRILTTVTGVNKDLASVSVERDLTDENSILSPGSSFNIFIKKRGTPFDWISVNLEVIDDDYQDDISISHGRSKTVVRSAKNTKKKTAMLDTKRRTTSALISEQPPKKNTKVKKLVDTSQSQCPQPSGFLNSSEPYFCPAVNFPPFPVGYTPDGTAYYGRSATIKSIPAGMSILGSRFYNVEGKPENPRNQLAGYDNTGQPFFIPRGCSIPQPAGFTVDGIAYYDIPSMMHHKGVLQFLHNLELIPSDYSTDIYNIKNLLNLKRESRSSVIRNNSLENLMLKESEKLLLLLGKDDSEATSDSVIKDLIAVPAIPKSVRIRRIKDFENMRRHKLESLKEEDSDKPNLENLFNPPDVVAFFRESEDLAYYRPSNIKITIDPDIIEFQSVKAPLTKSTLIRYKSPRGDHEEREFFIAIEPFGVFSTKTFGLKLQGEGTCELQVSFNPTAMKTEKINGSVNLIDEFGKKLAVCQLVGLRQSFIKVTPQFVDAGWILPEKRKEISIRLENISQYVVNLKFSLQSCEKTTSGSQSNLMAVKEGVFKLSTISATLQSLEVKNFSFFFEPSALGGFQDVLEIKAPGGDVIKIHIHGMSGIPLALYPENEESSVEGAASLTRERCEFMRKFRKKSDVKEKSHIPLTAKDTEILQSVMSASSDQNSRKTAHTLDFQLCPIGSSSKMRCLTMMNLSENPITVGLFPHSPLLTCPYLMRIAPKMAHTVEINFDIPEGTNIKGIFNTAIEVICPEFQNIQVHVTAFIGQPIFFPCWNFAFFKPTRLGRKEHLEMTLINESQYDISFSLSSPNQTSAGLNSSLSLDPGQQNLLQSQSVIPVSFTFSPVERGCVMYSFKIHIVSPFDAVVQSAMMNKELHLIGICIEPYFHKVGDIHDKNGINFLRTWMSHPKRLIDEYPTTPEEKGQRFDTRNVARGSQIEDFPLQFAKDPLVFRAIERAKPLALQIDQQRKTMSQPVLIQHKGREAVDAFFFGSTYFSVDTRPKRINVGDAENVDIIYLPPPDLHEYLTSYGFAIAMQESDHRFTSLQILAKFNTDFLIFPAPNSEGNVILDFGKVESASTISDITTKHVLLCNLFPTSYSWSVKMLNSKNKFSAFEIGHIMGELQPFDTYSLPFKVHCDSSGQFENSVEIYIKETSGRLAKPLKVITVILKAHIVNTSLTGLPESIDFGSAVVFQKKKHRFKVSNSGSTMVNITMLVRAPFKVEPKSISLEPKENYQIEVTYIPTESGSIQAKLLLYINQRLYMVPLSGTGGTSELICDKFEKKSVDFGHQREGTIAWLSIYLTNKGTLPLYLKAVTAENPEMVKLIFLDCTSTVPYETQTISSNEKVHVRKDYWSILRRKIKIFTVFKILRKVINGTKQLVVKDRESDSLNEEGTHIKIFSTSCKVSEQSLLGVVPQLKPFYSYHFRLGFSSKYQLKSSTNVIFHYMPITADEDSGSLALLAKHFKLNVTANVFRPLEIFPPFYDFGLAPAEAFLPQIQYTTNSQSYNYGVVREGENDKKNKMNIEVLNMSFEAQNLVLQFISSEFSVSGRSWYLQAGERLLIPMEFHPQKEQVQYHGEARFTHKYGSSTISMAGTGAAADLIFDTELDFGSVKCLKKASHSLKLRNRGLFSTPFTLSIIQPGHDFFFDHEAADDPFEKEGIIKTGESMFIVIRSYCQNFLPYNPFILLNWQRVEGGEWVESKIPLKIQVGIPQFKPNNTELDFNTTYINLSKCLQLAILNDGNASCLWEVEGKEFLSIEPNEGELLPGQTEILNILFSPKTYDPLIASITFDTDVGKKEVMCYGIVGVPYLQILEADLNVEYGIIEINKTHIKSIPLTNTGKKIIEYDIKVRKVMVDDLENNIDDFSVFFFENSHGIISPGQTLEVPLKCMPSIYNANCSAEFVVTTKDGEEYIGKIKSLGGKAIIKIAPPTYTKSDVKDRPVTAEMSSSKNSKNSSRLTSAIGASNQMDSMKVAYKTHIENLQEVLAGLRSAEIENSQSKISLDSRPGSSSKSLIFDGSDIKETVRRTKQRALVKEEKEKETLNSNKRSAKSGKNRISFDESAATMYTDKLSTFENELEDALGRPVKSTLNACTPIKSQIKASFGDYNPGSRPATTYDPYSSVKSSNPVIEAIAEPIEYFTTTLKKLVHEAEFTEDITLQKELISKINDRLLDETKNVIKIVKDQLDESWVVNRSLLTSAVRRLQISNHVFESFGVGTDAISSYLDVENDFNIGLFKEKEISSNILLFNLPNLGNMAFEYQIVPSDTLIVPPKFTKKDQEVSKLFVINNSSGTVAPKESVNLSASFQSSCSGYYMQGYDLISGGSLVLSFTVSARVGAPLLTISPDSVDFGKIVKGKTSKITLKLLNIGSYEDNFKIEAIPNGPKTIIPVLEEENKKSAINFSIIKDLIRPGEEVPITVSFAPPGEGDFEQKFKVTWTNEPLLFTVCGVGGCARIVPEFTDQLDKDFNGLDYGVSVVGVSYTKKVYLQNLGNSEGAFEFYPPSATFVVEIPKDASGTTRIQPNEKVEMLLTYTPVQKENLNENLEIKVSSNGILLIPVRGRSGLCDWLVEGELNLVNMSIFTTQKKIINVQNIGDFQFPVEIKLEPENLLQFFVLEANRSETKKVTIGSGQSCELKVSVTPVVDEDVEGSLHLITDHGKGKASKTLSFPFKFRAYEKQVVLDNNKDESVGRILVGEEAAIIRNLTNFGNKEVYFRSRIEQIEKKSTGLPGAAGKKSPKDKKPATPWRLKGKSEGILQADETIGIEAVYESLSSEDSSDWHEAYLVIEDSKDGINYSELKRIKLKGGGGRPRLEILPSILSFSHVPFSAVESTKILEVKFVSIGTAPLNYEILPGWELSDFFQIVEESDLFGRIEPEKEKLIKIMFSPKEEREYATCLKIKTQLDTLELFVSGEGAKYLLHEESLPRLIEMGDIMFGDAISYLLYLQNDCKYPIKVEGKIFKNCLKSDGNDADDILNENFNFTPKVIELSPYEQESSKERESFSGSISFQANLPKKMESGEIDFDKVAEMLRLNENERNYIELSVLGGKKHVIPITFVYTVKEITPLQSNFYENQPNVSNGVYKESDVVTKIDFGECNMDIGKSVRFVLHNPNFFPSIVMLEINSAQFVLEASELLIGPTEFKEVDLVFKNYQIADDYEIPKSITYSALLTVSPKFEIIRSKTISLFGILVDIQEELKIVPLNFGCVLKRKEGILITKFKNPARRAVSWKLDINKNMQDIFQGTMKPKEEIQVCVTFRPKIGTFYSTDAVFTTDDSVNSFLMEGQGVDATINCAEVVEFGVVGVGEPEYRILTIENPTLVSIKLFIDMESESSCIALDPSDLMLLPGEKMDIQLTFSPEAGKDCNEVLKIFNSDVGDGESMDIIHKVAVSGKSGVFDFEINQIDGVAGSDGCISLNFNKISQNARVRKCFEIDNTGETCIEIEVVDEEQKACGGIEIKKNTCLVKVDRATISIPPHSKQKITFFLKALKEGDETFTLGLRTKTLLSPRVIPIIVSVNIVSGLSSLQEGIKAFSRNDDSIEELINFNKQERKKYNSDLEIELWKILLPMVRLSPLKPSQELQEIPFVYPRVPHPEVLPYIIRPPAIPRDIPHKARKWYMERATLGFNEKNRQLELEGNPFYKRKIDALETISKLENRINLEKASSRQEQKKFS
ncbi:hypothetical protein HDU92_005399 [Lobulomyces angularis]|nr:hypothetical protein HDU92_005399 [Lobulomyces angularis]